MIKYKWWPWAIKDHKRMAIQVNKSSITVHDKIPVPFCTVLFSSISWDNVNILSRWTMELKWNYGGKLHFEVIALLPFKNKMCNFLSLFLLLFHICIFGRKMGLENLHSFDPGWLPWGRAFERKNWSEPKYPACARPPPRQQLNIDGCTSVMLSCYIVIRDAAYHWNLLI